jgi:hypothetical protein
MIKNNRSYKITKSQLSKLEKELIPYQKGGEEPLAVNESEQARYESYLVLYEDLSKEIEDYEDLKNGKIRNLELKGINRIPELLIKARIMKGWTHKDLAEKLEWKEQQIQRYEATEYDSATFGNMCLVAYALGIEELIEIQIKLDKTYSVKR